MVTFSIIVPVYGQWHLVPTLLDALSKQSVPASDYEVLLVNNHCPDYAEPSPLPDNVRIVHCATPGSYAARNLGVAEARGPWLVFTDADCKPWPNWLAHLHRAIEASEPVSESALAPVFAGAIEMEASEPPNRYEVYDLLRGIPQARYVRQGYAVTANLCVRRDVAVQHPFDETRFSGGDAAFSRALVAAGHPLHFLPKARVSHPARQSWRAISTKVRRIKGGQITAGTVRQRWMWGLRTLLPPVRALWMYAGLVRFPWRYRLIAMGLEMGLWIVTMIELLRLLVLRKAPERC